MKVEQFLNWAIEIFGENEQMLTFFDTSFDKVYAELEIWIQSTVMPYVSSLVSEVGSSVWKVLMFLYNVEGFLQWGFNFYNAKYSIYPIDPFRCTDGDYGWPAGEGCRQDRHCPAWSG